MDNSGRQGARPTPLELHNRPTHPTPGWAAERFLATDSRALRRAVDAAGPREVARAIAQPGGGVGAFAALLSSAAEERLEDMAAASQALTRQRFGRAVRMFAPLYLSNECVSECSYCGFAASHDIARRTLSAVEVSGECAALHANGFDSVLLVAGEHARIVSKEYIADAIRIASGLLASVAIEVQVWDRSAYEAMVDAGADGLVVYQETYDADTYAAVHLKGKKRNALWRLEAIDRGAAAGMRRLGIGALYGLHDDWRSEALACAAHADAILRQWWRCELSVAMPRMRPAAGVVDPRRVLDDRGLVQLTCAFRLAFPDLGLVLSTREPDWLRNGLIPLGITTISAGSHAEPGGYAEESDAEPQFEVADTRSAAEMAQWLTDIGLDPVWKDWQRA